MSNPGLLILAQAPASTKNLGRFVVEDNIGEAIHIHWNNFRADFSIAEFLGFADQFERLFESLTAHGYPDYTRLDAEILVLVGAQVGSILRIEQERRPLQSLKRVDATHPISKVGRQVVVFGDEPFIRFGADIARGLESKDPAAEIDVTVVHFSGDEWRLAPLLPEPQGARKNESGSLNPPPQTVLILAGMSGCGKSTVLRDALSQKNPIFGNAKDHVFQATRLPPRFPEDYLTLKERLSLNTWIHEHDLISMHQTREPARNLVVHFDLYWFLALASKWDPTVPNVQDEKRFYAFLLDSKRISEVFRKIFYLSPLKGAECVVKILTVDYAELCARWISRERDLAQEPRRIEKLFLERFIYRNAKDGKLLYENIHEGWRLAMSSVKR